MKEYSINSQPPPVRREEDSRKPIAGYFLRNGCRICNAASFHCTQWLVQPLSPCFVYWAGGHIICSPRYHCKPYPAETRTITLPDQTEIVLNRYSSLTYPERFRGKDRKVQLQGEAYFEVSKDAAHPFKVEAGAIIVQVLGTHFNVEAYPEDTQVKTTLLEGSVSVSLIGKAEESLILSPNESAIYNKDKKSLTLHTENNASEEIIWRNGTLLFKSIPLQEIVRQLSNAFHTDIRIEDADLQNYRMTATFSDGETLEEILSLLCRNQKFEYTKTNDIITITQKLN